MAKTEQNQPGCHPSMYQIKVKGKVAITCSDWLNGLSELVEVEPGGSHVTTLTGIIPDQAALRGILSRIWNLNMTILSVQRMDCEQKVKGDEK